MSDATIPEPVTNPGAKPATVADVRDAAAEEKLVAWWSSGLGALSAIIGIGATLMVGGMWVVDRAQAGVPAAIKPVADQATATAEALDRHIRDESDHRLHVERKLDRLDEKQDRTSQRLELLLDAARVPVSKRPAEP